MLSSFHKAVGDACFPEYNLNLERGESHVNWIFACISPSFIWEEEQVEGVVDIVDISYDPASFSMSLLPDGGGVLVGNPLVPNSMIESNDNFYNMNRKET